jgi:CBS domain-containing protein
MNASEVMKQPVYVCSIDASLDHVARVMWERDCGCVPLVDRDGRAVAIVTDRDVAMAAHLQAKPLHEIAARTAASRSLATVHEWTTLEDVENRMRDWQIRRVPVVDAEQRVVGIVTLNDIAVHASPGGRRVGALSAESISRTLQAICERRTNQPLTA